MSSGAMPNLPDVIWTSIANFLMTSFVAEVGARTTRRLEMIAEENVRPALFGQDRVFYVCRNFEDETTTSLLALQWRLRQCRILQLEDNHPSNSCFDLISLFPPAKADFDYAFYFEDAEMVREYNWIASLRAELAGHVRDGTDAFFIMEECLRLFVLYAKQDGGCSKISSCSWRALLISSKKYLVCYLISWELWCRIRICTH
jgi:hypothetical protein